MKQPDLICNMRDTSTSTAAAAAASTATNGTTNSTKIKSSTNNDTNNSKINNKNTNGNDNVMVNLLQKVDSATSTVEKLKKSISSSSPSSVLPDVQQPTNGLKIIANSNGTTNKNTSYNTNTNNENGNGNSDDHDHPDSESSISIPVPAVPPPLPKSGMKLALSTARAAAAKAASSAKPFVFDPANYAFSSKVKVLKCDNQIKELHTVLRDRETSHSDFKFYSDRLIRLLVEQGLNELPYNDCNVVTPAGCDFQGVKYFKGVCGVSIMRSGEAMEKGLRECCRSIRIGKILISTQDEKAHVVYAKFPNDVCMRKILLCYPITTTGSTINLAIQVLREHGVHESNIILFCLFGTPTGLQAVNSQFPDVDILTSEVHPIVPNDFGQRYFGTE